MTAIVFTARYGWIAPISLIGKSNNPLCFNYLYPGSQPTLYYRDQNNVWFDKEATQWWISTFLWSDNIRKHGCVNAVLILDDYLAQNIDM